MNHTPMAQKPHPHKETFNNKVQIYRLNVINKLKPMINSGTLIRKHLVTKFKVIDSILTNSNPQSIVDLLCLYKEWHHFQGTNDLYPSLQRYITFVSLLFPLSTRTKWYIYIYHPDTLDQRKRRADKSRIAHPSVQYKKYCTVKCAISKTLHTYSH